MSSIIELSLSVLVAIVSSHPLPLSPCLETPWRNLVVFLECRRKTLDWPVRLPSFRFRAVYLWAWLEQWKNIFYVFKTWFLFGNCFVEISLWFLNFAIVIVCTVSCLHVRFLGRVYLVFSRTSVASFMFTSSLPHLDSIFQLFFTSYSELKQNFNRT